MSVYFDQSGCKRFEGQKQKARSYAGLEVIYCFYVLTATRRGIIPTQLSMKVKLFKITVSYKFDLFRYHNLYHAENF